MQKTHYHNTGTAPVYIGGVCIPPGAAREVDARLVPGAVAPAAPAETGNPLLDLLDESVPAIIAELPKLTATEIDLLEAAEKSGKTRKGVLNAITEHRLGRARFIAELSSLSDEDLATEADFEGLPADLREAVVAERARRAEAPKD